MLRVDESKVYPRRAAAVLLVVSIAVMDIRNSSLKASQTCPALRDNSG